MSLATAVRSALINNVDLNSMTGERVYYMRFPQDGVQPAVAFKPINDVAFATHAGTSVLLAPEVRLTLRAPSLSTIEAMRIAIIEQWNVPEVSIPGYAAVQCQVNDLGADYDEQLDVYHHYITLNLQMRTI